MSALGHKVDVAPGGEPEAFLETHLGAVDGPTLTECLRSVTVGKYEDRSIEIDGYAV